MITYNRSEREKDIYIYNQSENKYIGSSRRKYILYFKILNTMIPYHHSWNSTEELNISGGTRSHPEKLKL